MLKRLTAITLCLPLTIAVPLSQPKWEGEVVRVKSHDIYEVITIKEQIESDMAIALEKKREEERQELLRLQIKKEAEEERIRLELERSKYPHFNPYNLTELSNLTVEQLDVMLSGTALNTLSNAIYWYEKEYNVNALFVTALIAEESYWGRSSLAISNNNLSGYKNRTGGWKYFDNWGESLAETFRLLGHEYLSVGGAFYQPSLSIYDVNRAYCPDPNSPHSWANNIIQITKDLLNKL